MEGTILRINGQDVWAEEITSDGGPGIPGRTAHAKHYHLPDGRYCAILQAGLHYRDRDTGRWEDCDHNVTAEARDGFSRAVNRAPLRARFGPGGKVRQGFGIGQFVTTAPVTVPGQPAQPVASANRVTYADLWTSADLVYEHGLERVKESIILRTSAAPGSYAFRVAETGGVTLTPNADGGIDVLDADGQTLGRMLAPFCEDAAGARGSASLVYDGETLTVTPDAAWLADPARGWPVVVDPTITLQPGLEALDTYTSASNPTTPYGDSADLRVSESATPYRAWLKPDISGFSASATISSADLELKVSSITGGLPPSPRSADGTWDETLTHNTAPGTGSWTGSSTHVNSTGWKTWTVTTVFQEWVSGSRTNYGIVLACPVVSSANFYAHSSDYSVASDRPKWTVTYTPGPSASITSPNGTQASPTTVNDDLTPTLSGVYTGGYQMTTRQHQIHDEAGNLIWDSGEVADTKSSGETVSVTVPAGLKYGTKYRWRWRAQDGSGAGSSWTANGTGDGCWFLCTLTAPTGLSAIFARASTAYLSDGTEVAANVPRLKAAAFGNGLRVEEGTTNILTVTDSQGFAAPVNVSVTNGQTYTVSMRSGSGSIALSGAGTGTVSVGTSVTFTASTTTLTLTPTGTVGRTQVENKGYATQWQIGGTARAAESAYIDHAALPTEWLATGIWVPDQASTISRTNNIHLFNSQIDDNNRYAFYYDPAADKLYLIRRKSGYSQVSVSSVTLTYSAGDVIRWATAMLTQAHADLAAGMHLWVKIGAGAVLHYTVANSETIVPSRSYIGGHVSAGYEANGLLDDVALIDVAKLESQDGVTVNNAWVEAVLGRASALPAYGAEIFRLTLDGHLESGLARPDVPNAEIDLSWTAHAGENLAGYNVYSSPDAGATWAKINTTLVAATTYSDKYVKSGTSMTYKITAVATDGYESAYSTTASATVTITGAWVQGQSVTLREPARRGFSQTRMASTRQALDGTFVTQDRGWGKGEMTLLILYQSLSERDTLLALFTAGTTIYYRDALGDRFHGRVSQSARLDEMWAGAGWLPVVLSEATPA